VQQHLIALICQLPSIAKELDSLFAYTEPNMIMLVVLELLANVVKELNVILHAQWLVKLEILTLLPGNTVPLDLDISLDNKDISVTL